MILWKKNLSINYKKNKIAVKIASYNTIVKIMMSFKKKQHKMITIQKYIVLKKNKKYVRFLMIYRENERI